MAEEIARWRRLPADPLCVLGSILLSLTIFLHIPATIYTNNPEQFSFSLLQILAPLSVTFGLALVILILPSVLLTGKLSNLYSASVAALAVCAWITSSFLVYDFGLLDGRGLDFGQYQPYVRNELLAITAGFVTLTAVAILRPRPVTYFLAALTVLLGVIGIASLVGDEKQGPDIHRDDSAFYRFSETQNVLIVLLDEFQSDFFAEIVEESPELRDVLDGFVFYPDALGVATSTAFTMPAIHSGVQYDPGMPLRSYYETTLAHRSFMTELARSGYETVLINPVLDVCPVEIELCEDEAILIEDPTVELLREAAFLIDLSLFRASPLRIKPHIYDHGNWILSELLMPEGGGHRNLRGIRLLEELSARLFVEEDRPTAKFLHLYSTHAPAVLDADCTFSREPNPWQRPFVKAQASCAVSTLVDLLASLEDAGAYDSTLIMLIADHGTNLPPVHLANADPGWLRIVSQASPLLAVKPPEERGMLRVSDAPVQLSDVRATVCTTVESCDPLPGKSVLTELDDYTEVERLYHDYIWRHIYWTTDTLPQIDSFIVVGPRDDPSSWQHLSTFTVE